MDNLTAASQRVGAPGNLGAHPNSHFLKQLSNHQRMDMFNNMFNLYLTGRFFKQDALSKDGRSEATHRVADQGWQRYDTHFRRASKMITMLLRHSDGPQIRLLRRNRTQGDIVLNDFLQTDVMRKNFPTLCPASLWAMAHCMTKKRVAFGTVTGTGNLRGDPAFTLGFGGFLRDKGVDPLTMDLVTIASCAGHSFVITRKFPESESEDIEILTETSYAKYGSICHGTHLYHNQSILRSELDVAFGVRAGLSVRNVIHFCVATNARPLKHYGLYCYLT